MTQSPLSNKQSTFGYLIIAIIIANIEITIINETISMIINTSITKYKTMILELKSRYENIHIVNLSTGALGKMSFLIFWKFS